MLDDERDLNRTAADALEGLKDLLLLCNLDQSWLERLGAIMIKDLATK